MYMMPISIGLVVFGACIMLYSILKYLHLLSDLRSLTNQKKLLSNWMYTTCLLLLNFFLVGYIAFGISLFVETNVSNMQLLVAAVFFFGAIFVLNMVNVVNRMIHSDISAGIIEDRLAQQELMSEIAADFITNVPLDDLITKSLTKLGEYTNLDRLLLSQYDTDNDQLIIRYDWVNSNPNNRYKRPNSLPFYPGRFYYDKFITEKEPYIAIDELDTEKFPIAKEIDLQALLTIPVYVDEKFWGVLEFDHCGSPYKWSDSEKHIGILFTSLFSSLVERKQLENYLVTAKEAAEKASHAKSDFLARMSHEIRTPMNAIIGMTTIAQQTEDLERIDYCLKKVHTASNHLLGLINDVLDMSKIEADKLILAWKPFNLRQMIDEVLTVTAVKLEEKHIHLNLDASSDIPNFIQGDEMRLKQVLLNILSNAIKFTPEKGNVYISVYKTEKEGVSFIQVEVRDTGIGIAPEHSARLFDAFEQVDETTAHNYGGTGLGLSISKSIVENMGGKITVDSTPGEGSTFTFNFPLKESSTTENVSRDSDVLFDISNRRYSKCRILLVDDIEINREIISALLEETGISFDNAEDGMEAWKMFKAQPERFDLILMDVQMPVMDGIEATKKIRSIDTTKAREIPILAMTANAFKEDVDLCREAGMNDHLSKPIDIDNLLQKLAVFLDGKQD